MPTVFSKLTELPHDGEEEEEAFNIGKSIYKPWTPAMLQLMRQPHIKAQWRRVIKTSLIPTAVEELRMTREWLQEAEGRLASYKKFQP